MTSDIGLLQTHKNNKNKNKRPGLPTNSDVIDIINYVIKLVGVDFLLLKVKFCDKYIY